MPIAAVTGGNKGIGLAIVRQLALRYPQSPLYARTQSPLLIYLTARNRERGQEAVKTLQNDPDLREQKSLSAQGGLSEISFEELDVSDQKSIDSFVSRIRDKHGKDGGLDVLVNNAGVAIDGFDAEKVRTTLGTNYFGTMNLIQAMLPDLVKPHGRIVNVSSMVGKLNKYSTELTNAFRSAAEPNVPGGASKAATQADPTQPTSELMNMYITAVQNGTHEKQGWPSSAYAVSKAGVTGATMALAVHEKMIRSNDGRLINACCPGYVNTDMTKGRGRKSVDDGADTPAFLALDDIGDATGGFWQSRSLSSW